MKSLISSVRQARVEAADCGLCAPRMEVGGEARGLLLLRRGPGLPWGQEEDEGKAWPEEEPNTSEGHLKKKPNY